MKTMVKTEDAPSTADGWKEVFDRNRSVPPPSQTVRLAADNHLTQSRGFQLCLSRILASHLPQVISQIHWVNVVPVVALTLTWLWWCSFNEGPLIKHDITSFLFLFFFKEENVAYTDSQSFIIQGELEFCTSCPAVRFCKFSLEIIHQTPQQSVIARAFPSRTHTLDGASIKSVKCTKRKCVACCTITRNILAADLLTDIRHHWNFKLASVLTSLLWGCAWL